MMPGLSNQSIDGHTEYDIVICGGGLSGLTLARQIKLEQPDRSILLLESSQEVLDELSHKPGEATTEAGAYYLSHTIGLPDYLEKHHLSKLGFRFFFGNSTAVIQERPEFGISRFPDVPSYNVDRGQLERDLRQFASDVGVKSIYSSRVQSVELGSENRQHTVCYREASGALRAVQARWVVDAMGRRRYLQKQLGLSKDVDGLCSAIWFRVSGRVDIDDFVPQHEERWHQRVPGRIRYASTSHLMGKGYWTWIIPLPTGNTSIGLVALESEHPFSEYNTYDRAMQWMQRHEPVLAAHLQTFKPLDFRCMRKYTYSSRQLFSQDRWACVGDAGLFSDPLYAPGVDFIALSNTMTTEMIRLDFANELSAEFVKSCNQTVIALNDALTHNIQLGYPLFDQPGVMAAKVLWDTAAGWGFFAPQVFNAIFKDAEVNLRVRKAKAGYYFLTQQMQQFFVDWAAQSRHRFIFDFIDFIKIPLLAEVRERNLRPGKQGSELIADATRNMEQIEELALAFFLVAVEDVMPEHLPQLLSYDWLNAWRITLDPNRWQADGLFAPRTAVRDIQPVYKQIRSLFQFQQRAGSPS